MDTTMRFLKAFPLVALACALLCSTALLAQHSTISPRITTDVNELSLATLKDNVPGLARAEFDQGEAAPSTQLTHMRLVLSRSSEQQAALDAYLVQLQDKSSPNYHKWLTPEQFGQLYGPADSDIAALVAWLESHGLQVETISKGRTNIAFNGTVSQVEEAFHTSIHSFQAGERQFYSNTLDPQIPSALAPVVKGVAHLNTIRPNPHFRRGNPGKINFQTGRLEPLNSTQNNVARPGLTSGSGTSTSPYVLWMVPGDAATIYDTPNSFNANFAGGNSYTGAGVNIGVGGDATITASIVGAYRSTFLGSSSLPILNYCTTSASCSTTPGSGYVADDADEAYLDTELSGGMAPGATIYYYASTDLYTGIEAAIDANVVDIFSLSFGDCEQDMGGSGTGANGWFNSLWEQAAGEGIAVTVSAGDSGSAGCDVTNKKSGANVPDATGGLAVNGFASTPYNIAVGGTDFYTLWTSNAVFEQYVSTSLGSAGAPTYYRTAKGYIPESTWNDSTYYDTTISADVPLSDAGENIPTSDDNIVAGSGGASVIYTKPAWQTGTGVPSDEARDLPDVSLMSGDGFDSATWLVCDDDTEKVSGTTVTLNCSNISDGYFDGFGGTSTASPAFAGILALVQQSVSPKTGCPWVNCSRLGMPATVLYGLFNGPNASKIFHDVTVGNNSVPCTSAPDGSCVKNAAGYYFESGYNTTAGYDLATGMGSVDATQLVNYWVSSTVSSATFALTATSPNASIAPGVSTTSTVTVSSSSGYTGTVTLNCALTTSPTGAAYLPSCMVGSTTVTLVSGVPTGAGQVTITVYTTAATSDLLYPKLPGRGWTGAGGGAVLALLLFLGIPARRRSWRSMLIVLIMMAALGSLAACGGSGGGGGGSTGTPGTTAGTYTFTVTGTGNPTVTPAPTATFTVTVN
jgi:hypothetical protein